MVAAGCDSNRNPELFLADHVIVVCDMNNSPAEPDGDVTGPRLVTGPLHVMSKLHVAFTGGVRWNNAFGMLK